MWPSNFPEQCPPTEARQDSLEVFRLVANDPPAEKDFRPNRIEKPDRNFKPADLCNACGISVFQSIDDAIRIRGKYKANKGKHIAKGIISPNDGFVLETYASSHTTWWLQTTTPHEKFKVVLPHVPS